MFQKAIHGLMVFSVVVGLSCTPYPRPARLSLPFLLEQVEPLVMERRFGEAIAALEEAAQIHPMAASPLIELGQIYLRQHRWLLAEDAFNRALARDLDNPLAMAGLAETLFHQNRLDEALKWWQQTVSVQPTLPGVFTGLGRTHLWRFEFELAQEAFQSQQSRHFDPQAAWYLAALVAPVDLSAAIHHLETITVSSTASARPELVERVLSRRDYLLTTLAPFTPESPQAEVAKATGLAMAQVELWPLAVHALSLARANNLSQPTDAEILAFLGHAMAQAGRPAFDFFEAARQADPDSALPLYFQALYFRRQGALNAAEQFFGRALDLDPDNVAIYIELAQTKAQQGKMAAAEAWYQAGLEVAGEDQTEWVQRLLVQFYAERGYRMVEAGLPAASALLEENPTDAELYSWLGWMQFLSGQPIEAETSLRRALELEPDLISARYSLARLLERQGDLGLALTEYRRVIDWDTSGSFRERALKDLQRLGKSR